MTLLILGIDALDAGLVERWNINPFKLSQWKEIETYSHGHDNPYTLEVWPTIATGLHAEEHGVTEHNSSDWDNPLLNFLSNFTQALPGRLQSRLGNFLESATSSEFALAETSAPTFFDGPQRTVHNWPGVTNGRELVDVWRMTDAGYSSNEFNREVLGKAAAQFGWAREMLRHDPVLAGVHIHALDVFGHGYAAESDSRTFATGRIKDLEHTYLRVGEMVENIRTEMSDSDDLLVLSDHGMTNELIDDEQTEFGTHSFRAFAASTIDDPLPDSVFDIYDWVEKHTEEGEQEDSMEMPKERLRKLGYIE